MERDEVLAYCGVGVPKSFLCESKDDFRLK
jgi:hypothetical protein